MILAAMPLAGLSLPPGCMDPPPVFDGADAGRGRAIIAAAGCGTCHEVPGIRSARGRVGPSLEHIASRSVLIGTLPNTPDTLLAWIKDPQGIRPGDAMPNTELSDHDARDVVAYLSTLR